MLWVVRAAEQAESELRALQEGRIHASWCDLRYDLSVPESPDELLGILTETYQDLTRNSRASLARTLWSFAREIAPGDWLVVPTRRSSTFHVGEVVGTYSYTEEASELYRHSRELRWVATSVPRSRLDVDLRHAFSGFMRVFRAHRNDAEARLLQMGHEEHWALVPPSESAPGAADSGSLGDDSGASSAKWLRRRLEQAWMDARSAEAE